MLELQDMGVEFVEALRCLANVLKAADHRQRVNDSLCFDIERRPERHLATMYKLSRVNEQMGFRIFQPFPLRRSFIPSFIPLDLTVVSSVINVEEWGISRLIVLVTRPIRQGRTLGRLERLLVQLLPR